MKNVRACLRCGGGRWHAWEPTLVCCYCWRLLCEQEGRVVTRVETLAILYQEHWQRSAA